MQLGIFAKTFSLPTVEDIFRAVKSCGLDCVQFNMSCVGLAPLPDKIERHVVDRIRAAASEHHIQLPATSGTFNMIHPDPAERLHGLRRLAVLGAACEQIGSPVITLCTGSRDAQDMWRKHPDNDKPDAWEDLILSMREAIRIVDGSQVTLAFEPEVANVVDSARKARKLLDEIASPHLRVVLDAANLFQTTNISQMDEVLHEAFNLLAPDIVIAHAKDVEITGGQIQHVAAGMGRLNYDQYLLRLQAVGEIPLIMHGLTESQIDPCVAFLRDKLSKCGLAGRSAI